jgi:hypothetical protein
MLACALLNGACGLLRSLTPPVQSSATYELVAPFVAREEQAMFVHLWNQARRLLTAGAQVLQDRQWSWTKPPSTSLARGSVRDLARSKPQLVIENALLRQLSWLVTSSVALTRHSSAKSTRRTQRTSEPARTTVGCATRSAPTSRELLADTHSPAQPGVCPARYAVGAGPPAV